MVGPAPAPAPPSSRPPPPFAGLVSVEGKTYPPVSSGIEPQRVADFARSIGADLADAVPPTFAAVYSLVATAPYLFGDPYSHHDFSHLFPTDHDVTWYP